MSAQALPSHAPDVQDLGDAAAQLAAISENLLSSYARLARHAERVEAELLEANAELARRVDQVESLRSHLDAVLRALPCGVVVLDERGRIASANPAACALLAASERDLVRAGGHAVLDAASADGRAREHVLADGARRSFVVRRSPVPGLEGRNSVVIVDDRTEERRLEAELAARSKMAALGTMAGGIAHEIRNPLNAVRGFAELLRGELEESSRAHRFATRVCQGVDEADGIIQSLLGFAAPEKLVREWIDAAELVEEALAAARRDAALGDRPERWTVGARVDCARFQGDRIKLRQALRNLVANALQAQPDGGRAEVEVRQERGEVELRVHDAGPGLAPAVRGRAGEPFLTTRAEGTGLGLALVHAIAGIHGGRFEIRAEPGPLGGADARITFPSPTC